MLKKVKDFHLPHYIVCIEFNSITGNVILTCKCIDRVTLASGKKYNNYRHIIIYTENKSSMLTLFFFMNSFFL